MSDHVKYYDLDELLERRALEVPDSKHKTNAARRLWLHWIGRLKKAASKADTRGWAKSEFSADKSTGELRDILAQFCRGRVPFPKSEGREGRFDSLFEIIAPSSPPKAYPVSLSYSGVPVGSPRGVGVSPSASQYVPPVDPARYENYVDGPTVKSRSRGKNSHVRLAGGKVVQTVHK